MGESGDGGAEARYFSFGQRLPSGERTNRAISGGYAKPGGHEGALGCQLFRETRLAAGVFWQMPLAPDAQEVFTIATPEGLFTPTRVPQGVLNATSYFQGVMTDLLHGLDCKVWVDDVFYFADSEEALLTLLDEILGRLESVGCSSQLTSARFFPEK